MEKQAVLFPYCGILLSSIKESTDTDHPDDLRCALCQVKETTHKKQQQQQQKTVGLSSNMGSMQKQRFRKIKHSLERLGLTFKRPSHRANSSQEKTIRKNQGKIQVTQSLGLLHPEQSQSTIRWESGSGSQQPRKTVFATVNSY